MARTSFAPRFIALLVALLSPAMCQSPDTNPADNNSPPLLRFICVTSLTEEQEIFLASLDAEGKLIERGTVKLRSPLVTAWIPAKAGELHLAVREEKILKSICHFQYPAGSRRALVVLIANPENNTYDIEVFDPEKAGFVKGSVMILNSSPHIGKILFGSTEQKVDPGQRVVVKPDLDDQGMYRMLVSYPDANKESVQCYDRYVSGNPNSRNMVFLLPAPSLGIRVSSLPIFGDLE